MVSVAEVANEVYLRIDQGDDPDVPKLTKNGVFEIIKAAFDICSQAIEAGEDVSIPKFGKFIVAVRTARKARNPRTGKTVDVPEKLAVKFRPSSNLRAALAEADVSVKKEVASKKEPKTKTKK